MRTGLGSGTLLDGRYRFMQRVGSGGMADVWSATDEVLERVVAVKLFRFDTDMTDDQRIQNEIRTVAALAHPGIVTVFDAGTVADPESDGLAVPYLVMEYVPGRTLANRITSVGPLYEAEARALGITVAETLAYVHGRGVIHRDIKPANLLLPETATGPAAKITDFGIARMVDSAHHTATGLTVGTPNYLAPEQATGSPVGFPADVYALGLVLLECLTGSMAYPGTGVEAALARLHRQPTIPASLAAPWPDLLAAMTAQEPASRPSAADVVEALGGTRPRVAPPVTPVVASDATTALLLTDALQDTGPLLATGGLLATGPGVAAGWHEPAGATTGSHRRRSVGLSVLGAMAAAGIVSGIVLSSGGHGGSAAADTTTAAAVSPTAAKTPAAPTVATYASVSGRLGQDLAALELTIAPNRDPELQAGTRQLLSDDLVHVAAAAKQHSYRAAASMLAIFKADLAAARSTDKITATRAATVRTAAAAVQADLAGLTATHSATPTVQAVTKAPAAPAPAPSKAKAKAKAPAPVKGPPANHDHGKHKGHGKG